MWYVLVDTRMPYGDHIKSRNFNRWLQYRQAFIVLAEQAGRDERYKIVRLQDVRHQQEARHRVANLAAQPQPGKRTIGRALERSPCRRHQNVVIAAEALDGQAFRACKRMLPANRDDVAFAVKQA